MGCGASSGLVFNSDDDDDDTGYFEYSKDAKHTLYKYDSRPLRKQLDIAFGAYKQVNQLSNPSILIDMWKEYFRVISEQNNIFRGVVNKHPEVTDLFSSSTVFDRHSNMVNQMLENCLVHIRNGNTIDMGLALHRLGCFHSQKGVTVSQLNTFAETTTTMLIFISMCSETSSSKDHRPTVRDIKTIASKSIPGNEIVRETIRLIVEFMLLGVQKHDDVMAYVKMLMDKRDTCWSRKRLEKRCHMHLAPKSWMKLYLHVSRL